jgi:coproporphyrinogen III oxidase
VGDEPPRARDAEPVSLHRRARDFFAGLQDDICAALEAVDGKARFRSDEWRLDADGGGGGGVSRVLAGGNVLERAGVNLADVTGRLSDRLARHLELPPQDFLATGLSLVVHPLSPHVPAVHMNVRHLELTDRGWFGGGTDLTPYYLVEQDAVHFHRTLRAACDRHDPSYYARFKQACDEYFFLRHRGEARGVGGIFFDYLGERPEETFAFVQDVGRSFTTAYLPIVEARKATPWGDRERHWQLVRRGRYVEFNLIQDRGTLFGLETGGRTESILMSLPPLVRWVYDHRPEPGSPEDALVSVLKAPRGWA